MDEKSNSHIKIQGILNIIKMKYLYDTQDYRAKQNYPDTNPNPIDIKVCIQLNGCMQQCDL
jgi:hypothetical protein